MIKFETIGGIEAAKINPTITSDKAVKNYSFITVEDILYIVMNTVNGDDSYVDDITFEAGEYLDGIDVKSLENLKLIVDGKHITDGVADLTKGSTLIVADDGTLKTGTATDGVYFEVTDTGIRLTEAAVKVRVKVATGATA